MQPPKTAININTILCHGPELARLYKHSNNLLNLQSIIRSNINSPECDHVFLASVSHEAAILYTDSPSWAAKLRFHTQQLIDIIRNNSEFPHLSTVRIKVSPALYQANTPENPAKLSPKTSKFIEEIANSIDDREIQTALLRLSKHG